MNSVVHVVWYEIQYPRHTTWYHDTKRQTQGFCLHRHQLLFMMPRFYHLEWNHFSMLWVGPANWWNLLGNKWGSIKIRDLRLAEVNDQKLVAQFGGSYYTIFLLVLL